jgi:hypothetical protein
MKPFNYYSKSEVLYPSKTYYVTLYAYDKGAVVWSGAYREKSKCDLKKEYPNAVIQEVLDEYAYQDHLRRYHEESRRLHEEFKSDLYAEFGVSDHPKRDKVFNLAREYGRESGHENVYNYFADLVVLIKD